MEKQKLRMQNLTKKRKQSPVAILWQVIFYIPFILCLWLRIIRSSDQGLQFMNFPSQIFFNDINLDTEQQYWRKIICGCFRFTWMWLFISIMKRCAEWCALQLYHTSLKKVSAPVMKCHTDRCVHHFCKIKVNFSEIHVKSDHHGFNICYNFIIFN